jgi:hypothetical protein
MEEQACGPQPVAAANSLELALTADQLTTPTPGYLAWDYRQRNCQPVCHEAADEPSPRTSHSTFQRPERFAQWWYAQDWMAASAARACAPDLILLGDGITESLVGTHTLQPCPGNSCAGVPAVLASEAAGVWQEPLVLGIAGDETQHLLWRMDRELTPTVRESGAVINLLIGTDNLHPPAQVALGIRAIVERLMNQTRSAVLVNKLLPRGGEEHAARVRQVNLELDAQIPELASRYAGRVAGADCGGVLIDGSGQIDGALMPDGIHPNAAGHTLYLRCLVPHLVALRTARLTVVK